jgi:short-subunit dehydrogenase
MKKGKVIVITGAGAGVGRATARAFGKLESKVGLIGRGADRLETAKQEIEKLGGKALVLACDVADPEAVENAAERVEQEFGPIDIWVNNAMVTVFAPFKAITASEFKRVTEVTYLGQVYGTMSALKRMIPRNSGTIVQVGSALADRSIPLQSAYCGAKHAIRGFTDSIRSELVHDNCNVHLTMVQLPAMNTPQFDWSRSKMPEKAQPVPPIYEPEIAADAIVWAAFHKKREMYVGASTCKAMYFNKFFSGLIDKYLGISGYNAQQTNEPENPDRPDNLFGTVPRDVAAHGRFTEKSRNYSPELWCSKNAKWIWACTAVLGLWGFKRILSAKAR